MKEELNSKNEIIKILLEDVNKLRDSRVTQQESVNVSESFNVSPSDKSSWSSVLKRPKPQTALSPPSVLTPLPPFNKFGVLRIAESAVGLTRSWLEVDVFLASFRPQYEIPPPVSANYD